MRLLLAVVLLLAAGPAGAQIATYEQGLIYDLDPPALQAATGRSNEMVVGTAQMEPVRDLAEGDVLRRAARPVGRLVYRTTDGKTSFCTASVIAADLVLTNRHCAYAMQEAMLWMGYLVPRSRVGVAQYPVVLPPVEINETLDYAILRTRGRVGDEWGTVSFSLAEPRPRQSLFVVHHPGGYPQRISLGGCRAADPAIEGDDLMHTCDTLPGSSGAPIFDMGSRKVIGLHYSAVALQGLNAAKQVKRIAAISQTLARLTAETEPPTVVRAAPSLSEAARMWAEIRDTDNPSLLKLFGEQYQGTVQAALALDRLARLEAATQPTTPAAKRSPQSREADPEDADAPLTRLAATTPDAGTPPTTAAATTALASGRAPFHACDELAAAPNDERRVWTSPPKVASAAGGGEAFWPPSPARGVEWDAIGEAAVEACRTAVKAYPNEPRFWTQLGRALDKNDVDAEAVYWYRRAAEADYPIAKYFLGTMYEDGTGVAKDLPEALRWYRSGAESGSASAMFKLGRWYQNGIYFPKDMSTAFEWFKRAADADHAAGTNMVGLLYDDGNGVARDEAEAVRWYKRAIALGSDSAMNNLAKQIQDGAGIEKDSEAAVLWYRRAIEAGNNVALGNLGWLVARGEGAPTDPEEGARMIYQSIARGNAHSRDRMVRGQGSRELHRAFQRLLRDGGFYSGTIDGSIGPQTRQATQQLFNTDKS